MRIQRDLSKCVDCKLCLDACPKKPKDFSILSCDFEFCARECFYACPRRAIVELGGTMVVVDELCNGCGACVRACPKKAIALDGKAKKCDLCYATGEKRCIAACPYGALEAKLSRSESERLKEIVGWDLGKTTTEEMIEGDSQRQICRSAKGMQYVIQESALSYDEALILKDVLESFRSNFSEYEEGAVEQILDAHCAQRNVVLKKESRKRILDNAKREIKSFSILDVMLDDPALEEITVLGHEKVYVYHRKHGWLETNVSFSSNKRVIDLANKMSRNIGRRMTLQKPRINANITLGRLHAAREPIAVSGPCMTIRKFGASAFTPRQLAENGTISYEALAFLWLAVQCDSSVLICGSTGSGKTSTLNTLFSFVPAHERIVIVEETPEIVVPHEHCVRLAVCDDVKIGMPQLVQDTLRMRPDRVIVGEVRTADEARALMDTLLAGQGKSSFATFHAQDSAEAVTRLKSLGINGCDLSALDLIVCQNRWTRYDRGNENVRRVTEISCIENGTPKILFSYNAKKDALERHGLAGKAIKKIARNTGLDNAQMMDELTGRESFLRDCGGDFAESFTKIGGWMDGRNA